MSAPEYLDQMARDLGMEPGTSTLRHGLEAIANTLRCGWQSEAASMAERLAADWPAHGKAAVQYVEAAGLGISGRFAQESRRCAEISDWFAQESIPHRENDL
jgi:hypothetical protein